MTRRIYRRLLHAHIPEHWSTGLRRFTSPLNLGTASRPACSFTAPAQRQNRASAPATASEDSRHRVGKVSKCVTASCAQRQGSVCATCAQRVQRADKLGT